MKYSFCFSLIFFLICPLDSYSENFSSDDLIQRNGLFYNKFSDELFSGTVEFRFGNGQLRSQGFLKNGRPEGYWEDFNEDGTYFSKGNYKDGKPNGNFQFYHENGVLEEEGIFVLGIKEGNWKTYWDNGNLKRIGDWKKGKANGLFKFFNYHQKLLKVETWENGNKVKGNGST